MSVTTTSRLAELAAAPAGALRHQRRFSPFMVSQQPLQATVGKLHVARCRFGAVFFASGRRTPKRGGGASNQVMHRPRTIKAAMLAGFLVIFAVWLGSTFYFTERLARAQAQSAAIHARFARGQELLFALQSQVLLASIYVRDAIVADEESPVATTARDQLRALQLQVKQELEQYDAVEPPNHGAAWGRLKAEVQNYWDAAVRLASPAPKESAAAEDRLRDDVIARGDVIVRLSDDLRQVMADNANQEQQQVGETNATLRRWIWGTTGVATAVGVAIAAVALYTPFTLRDAIDGGMYDYVGVMGVFAGLGLFAFVYGRHLRKEATHWEFD